MRLPVLVLLALAFPGVSLGATGQGAGKNVNPAVSGDASSTVVTATGSSTARKLKDWMSAAEVIRPSGDTSGATDVAAINAATAAGRSVQLTDGVYYVNAPINLGNGSTGVGYTIHGVPWSIDGAWDQILSGTEIRAVGSIAIMQYAPATYASQPTFTQLQDQAIKGVSVQNIAFRGGTYAIRVGTQFNTGVMWGTFKNLIVRNWTGWGFWFENCAYVMFEKIYAVHGAPSAIGNVMFAASQSAYNHGNNTVMRVFAENSAPLQRGVVFRSYGGTTSQRVYFNDINAFDIQNNQGGTPGLTATATSTGTAALTLSGYGTGASIASYPVDMPVTVATTSLGLTKWQTYFVVSNDGSNTIQISDMQGGTAKTVTAGSVGIVTNGFPSIEIVGRDGSTAYSQITGSTFHGVDAEGTASNEVVVQNSNVDLGMTYAEYEQGTVASRVFTALVSRRSYGSVRSTMRITTDFDSVSRRLIFSGGEIPTDAYPTSAALQGRPPGFSYDSALGTPALTFDGFSPFAVSLYSQNTDTSSFLYPAQPIGQRAGYSTQANRQLTQASGGGSTAYVGSGATTWTLPRLRAGAPGTGSVASSAGETYDIANCEGAATLTIKTWSATNGANQYNGNVGAADDTFMRNAGKTSYSCPTGASLSVRANYDGTKAFWQVIANNGCT